MTDDAIAVLFAELMQKHYGARIITVPAPTPEELAEMERYEAALAALSDEALIAIWDAADETDFCCDDLWSEAQRRGLGRRVSI